MKKLCSQLALVMAGSAMTILMLSGGPAGAFNVPNNSVNSAKIVNGSVQGIDIKNGTLRGIDVANQSLTNADIAPGAVTDWFQGYSDRFTLEESSAIYNGGQAATFDRTAVCPTGTRAVAGGGSSTDQRLFITRSEPLPTRDGWKTTVRTADGTVLPDAMTYTVWALCMPPSSLGN